MPFSELSWIDFLKAKVKKSSDVLTGIGDDCALVKIKSKKALLKSDLFIEGIHFRLKETPFKTIGLRAVGRVLSDFAACGGTPKFIGISIGISPAVSEKNIKEILKGVTCLCRKYNFSLVGGDTAFTDKLFLDVWAIGTCDKFIRRNTAKEGDYIFVTGKLGRRKFNESFTPRLIEAGYLVRNFKINSMIDISDGFALDLYRILKESGKGALLYKKNMPIDKISDLYRGEDYELIFTVSGDEKKIDLLKSKFYLVGTIKSSQSGYRMSDGKRSYNVDVKGYMHF
jgi:thiamine-monophosphate kinase